MRATYAAQAGNGNARLAQRLLLGQGYPADIAGIGGGIVKRCGGGHGRYQSGGFCIVSAHMIDGTNRTSTPEFAIDKKIEIRMIGA